MPTVRVRLPAQTENYDIRIGAGVLANLGDAVRGVAKHTLAVAVISNRTVFDLYGATAVESLRNADFAVKHFLAGEGERHKSFSSLKQIVTFLAENRLERNDVIVALGGGVVGDLAGFAAAIYLRGISFVQVPTTLLAQIDASVGGKTGINLSTGKNLVGAFHQPRLVVVDTDTLATLARREMNSGLFEMVKQGAIGGRKLFDQTVRLLRDATHAADVQRAGGRHAGDRRNGLAEVIAAHCRFKASIVAGDERENTSRVDARSRRILNFGHTTAHALEKITGYRHFRHGEAVGYGMLVAGEISKSLGMLPSRELELLQDAVALCGPLPRADGLPVGKLIQAMAADKKSTAGKINWVLLERIGRPRIVDASEIGPDVLRAALRGGLRPLA